MATGESHVAPPSLRQDSLEGWTGPHKRMLAHYCLTEIVPTNKVLHECLLRASSVLTFAFLLACRVFKRSLLLKVWVLSLFTLPSILPQGLSTFFQSLALPAEPFGLLAVLKPFPRSSCWHWFPTDATRRVAAPRALETAELLDGFGQLPGIQWFHSLCALVPLAVFVSAYGAGWAMW